MEFRQSRAMLGLSTVLTVSLAIASFYGAFVPATYARDSASMGAQGLGQDFFDLFFVVPLLVISLTLALRGNRISLFIFAGTLFYITYSFMIYAFGVHFNSLFLIYCLVPGSSLYTFLFLLYGLTGQNTKEWFSDRVPARATGMYFIIIATVFYLLWLKDVVPAILIGSVPVDITENRLLVNPVHVLDMAIVLPGLVLTSILLLRRHPLGYIFTPIFLVFTVLLALAIISMIFAMRWKGVTEDVSASGIFVVLASMSAVFLILFFKNLRADTNPSKEG